VVVVVAVGDQITPSISICCWCT